MNTETEQFLVIDIAAAQELAAKNPLSAMDARSKFKDAFKSQDFDAEIQKIHEKYTQAAAPIITNYKTQKAELDELDKGLKDSTSEIEKIQAQQAALEKINVDYNYFILKLPQEARAHIGEKLRNRMLSDDELIKEVKSKLGLFRKLRLNPDPILVAYTNLTQTMENSDYNAVPLYNEEYETLKKRLNDTETTKKSLEIDVTRKAAQAKEVKRLAAMIREYFVQMNTEIGQLLVAMNDTTTQDYIEAINPSINMENLTEPVAFFQRLNLKDERDVGRVIELLQKVGLKAARGATSDPTEYIVRYPQRKDSNIELITPFYSPEKAHTNITALAKYLARNGINIEGVIHPTTLKQLDPRISVGYKKTMSEHDVASKIREKLKKDAEKRTDLIQQFGSHSDDFLFRGQNFITSDPASSYATLTWRPGRTGLAYATDDISYAFSYSGGTDTESMSGGTAEPQYLNTIWGKMPVGFVTIYRRSPKNKMLPNLALEEGSFRFPGEFEKTIGTQYNETAVNPHDNPVVARYLVSGTKCIKVDENDPEWHQILDYFSPYLEATHQSGLGPRFIEKLNELRKQADANDGQVETHDLTEDQLEAMRMKREQFEDAKQKLIDKYKHKPDHVQSHQMDTYRD